MTQDVKKQKNIIKYVEDELDHFFHIHEDSSPEPGLYNRVINEIEKILIQKTIIHCNHVHIKAAKILGINRNTLRKKINDLKIKL